MKPDIPSLVAARMAHDLANPIGAIGNGLELLELSGAGGGPEIDLIKQASGAANARLRLFRLAFSGRSAANYTIQHLVEDWNIVSKTNLACEARAVFEDLRNISLILLGLESCMPKSGDIHLMHSSTGVGLKAQGKDLVAWTQKFANTKDTENLAPSDVQFAILKALLESQDQKLLVHQSEMELSLRLVT